MRLSAVCAALFFSIAALAVNRPVYPQYQLAQFVAETLDVTLFPSSIGPRRITGKTSFRDYGFVVTAVDEKRVTLEQSDRSWRFAITVLGRSKSGVLVCLEDQALSGGTYHTQSALRLARPDSESRLKGSEERRQLKACPAFAK